MYTGLMFLSPFTLNGNIRLSEYLNPLPPPLSHHFPPSLHSPSVHAVFLSPLYIPPVRKINQEDKACTLGEKGTLSIYSVYNPEYMLCYCVTQNIYSVFLSPLLIYSLKEKGTQHVHRVPFCVVNE